MGAIVTDPNLCDGCTCCQRYVLGESADGVMVIDESCLLCSNMRLVQLPGRSNGEMGDGHRLTTGDVVFMAELSG